MSEDHSDREDTFERFAETVANRAYVIAHPDTFADFRRNLPLMMAALDRLVQATHGEYVPHRYCESGKLYAMPYRELTIEFPKVSNDDAFRSIEMAWRYGQKLRQHLVVTGV